MKLHHAISRAGRRGKDSLGTYGVGLVILIAGTLAAYQFIDPAPPREITLATGEPGGAYEKFGERYADLLSQHGITVQLRNTAGSLENLELLAADTDMDLGFVQSGMVKSHPSPGVVALGSLFFEPLWLFLRPGFEVADIQELRGARIAVGAKGSGTRVVALTLLEANGHDEANMRLFDLPQADIAAALTSTEVDGVFLVASPESKFVKAMIDASDANLHDFNRTAAYGRIYPFLSAMVLPEGLLDIERKIPAADLNTVAPAALLAARDSLHPALVDLLLVAAREIFGHSGMLSDAGQFPTAQYSDLPVSAEASRHYQYGPPFLLRVLPFWAATLVDLDAAEAIARLDRIEHQVAQLTVPLAYTDELYKLRRDIDLVRRKLNTVVSLDA